MIKNKAQAAKQIHGMRLVASKPVIASSIEKARLNGKSPWSVLRNRSQSEYDLLLAALNDSR